MRPWRKLLNPAAAVVVLLVAACQSNGSSEPAARQAADGTSESALASLSQIKPLDDRDNPYAGQYQEWDYWIAANAVAVTAPGINPNAIFDFNPDDDPELTGHIVSLDQNGYLLPLVEDCKLLEEFKLGDRKDIPLLRRVASLGKMDPDLYTRSVNAYEEARASYYAEIPGWLAENPPLMTVLLPNGDIATKGMPGSGTDVITPLGTPDSAELAQKQGSDCCGGDADNPGWYRYSRSGELLGSTSRDFWWYLYYDPDLQPLPEGKLTIRNDGYAVFTDLDSGHILTVLDWDGSSLLAVEPPRRAIQPFAHLTPLRLQSYYSAQQRILSGKAAPGIVMNPAGLELGGSI